MGLTKAEISLIFAILIFGSKENWVGNEATFTLLFLFFKILFILRKNALNSIHRLFYRNQAPAILWALLIFVVSSIPNLSAPKLGIEFQDKWQHLIVYGIFGYLLCRAFYFQDVYRGIKHHYIFYTILVGILYGITDEIHQYFVPGRYSETLDVIADALGVLLGLLLFQWHLKRQAGSSGPGIK